MDIKELDKKQLILLTLLITFVVSIATGIVTVSLMNQMPKSIPQTINNVIQRTIEKVTTVEVPAVPKADNTTNIVANSKDSAIALFGNSEALVSIYSNNANEIVPVVANTKIDASVVPIEPVAIGKGVIISDIGLVLVDSSLITDEGLYKVVLNKKDFNVSILKRFSNGFTILKISPIDSKTILTPDSKIKTQ